MSDHAAIEFSSARLSFRAHVDENFARLHQWMTDPEIRALSSDDVDVPSADDTKIALERWMRRDGDDIIHLAIHARDSGAFIGFAHIAFIDTKHKRCKIGLVIGDKTLWGQGLGTECLRRLIEFCFVTLGLNRVAAEAYSSNPRACRMMERVGFRREGVLRENVYKAGAFVDEIQYGLLRSD